MKVICTGEIGPACAGHTNHCPPPQIGDICTVVKTVTCKEGEFYVLEEFDERDAYRTSKFSPLSDIDEKEMIREQKLEECDATEV